MKPICRSKTFQKGEDIEGFDKFIYECAEFDTIQLSKPWEFTSVMKHKTIITITKSGREGN